MVFIDLSVLKIFAEKINVNTLCNAKTPQLVSKKKKKKNLVLFAYI